MTDMKRMMYWIFLITLTIVAAPVMIIVACMAAFVDGPPILYRQRRVGLGGKPFTMYKFRTMVRGADETQKNYMHLNEANGPVFKIYDDPRFTSPGKFLSHTGLDELPQLVNVIKGDMSLIGPRPLPLAEAAKLKKWQLARHAVKPGIISPWIFEGYHHRPFDGWMKSDIRYAREKSFWRDLGLSGRAVVFVGRLCMREVFRGV